MPDFVFVSSILFRQCSDDNKPKHRLITTHKNNNTFESVCSTNLIVNMVQKLATCPPQPEVAVSMGDPFSGHRVFRFDHRGVFLEYRSGRPYAYVSVPEQAPSSSMTAAQAPSSSMAEDQAPSSSMTASKSKKRMHKAAKKAVAPKVIKSTKYTTAKRMLKAVMA